MAHKCPYRPVALGGSDAWPLLPPVPCSMMPYSVWPSCLVAFVVVSHWPLGIPVWMPDSCRVDTCVGLVGLPLVVVLENAAHTGTGRPWACIGTRWVRIDSSGVLVAAVDRCSMVLVVLVRLACRLARGTVVLRTELLLLRYCMDLTCRRLAVLCVAVHIVVVLVALAAVARLACSLMLLLLLVDRVVERSRELSSRFVCLSASWLKKIEIQLINFFYFLKFEI